MINLIRHLLFIAFVIFVSSVNAQVDTEQLGNVLSTDIVDSRIKQLSETDDADSELVRTYKKASDLLETAALHNSNIQKYLTALNNAPKLKKEILEWIDQASSKNESQEEFDFEKMSNDELQSKLPQLRVQLSTATNKLNDNQRSLSARDTNVQKIVQRQEEILDRLTQLSSDPIVINKSSPPNLAEALNWLQAAERIALNAEQKALEFQLESQPARYDLLNSQQVKLELEIEQLTSQISAIETYLIDTLVDDDVSEIANVSKNSPIYNILEDVVNDRSQFQKYRAELVAELNDINDKNDHLQKTVREIEERQASISRIVEFAGDSRALGNILLVHWREIKSFQIADPTQKISDAIGDTIIKRIGYEESQEELTNTSKYIKNLLAEAGLDSSSLAEDQKSIITDQLQLLREELSNTIKLQSDYLEVLRKHLRNYAQFLGSIKLYETYVGSRILWEPSHSPIYNSSFKNIPNEIQDVFTSLKTVRLKKFPITTILGLLAGIILFLLRNRFMSLANALNHNVGKRKDSILLTLSVLGLNIAKALPLPVILLSLSYAFTSEQISVAEILSLRIQTLAMLIFLPLLICVICEENAVGLKHFIWNKNTCRKMIEGAHWWLYRWIPIFAISSIFVFLQAEAYDTVLDQVVSLGLILYIFVYIARSFLISEEKLSGIFVHFNQHRIKTLFFVFLLLVLVWLTMGYVYTARTLIQTMIDTLWLSLFIVLIYNLLKRWFLLSQRKIRIAEFKAKQNQENDPEQHLEEDRIDLVDISRETAKLLKVMIGVIAIMLFWYIWEPLLPALNALQRITLWSTTASLNGENIVTSVTLTSLLQAISIAIITIYTAGKLPALIEFILRRRTGVSASASYTVSTLLNYIILGAGVIIVLSQLGLNWSKLQWLVAALGVGIGFGLQEIVANFISGLIILFERPIRVGDVVTTGDNDGVVSRIRIRATTIVDWDGKELLVPNKEFITGRVLNWTLSNSTTRILINVGVAYGSDISKALEILREAVTEHKRVIDNPTPTIIFKDFGDNTLNLSARAFIDSMDDRLGVISEINQDIYKRFETAGIVIAFPQRDIHFDSENPIQVSIQPKST